VRRALVVVGLVAACGRIGFPDRSGDAGAGDTADTGDAGGSTLCGTTLVLADAFSGTTPGPQWYPFSHGGVTPAQGSGELVITLPATTAAGSNYGGYDSARRFDLRGSRTFVEVNQTVSAAGHAQTDFSADGPKGESLSVSEEAGMLYATFYNGMSTTTLGSMPYDPVAHHWWQMRESQGTVYFETSPDGVTFTPFAMTPTPAFAPFVDVLMDSGTYQAETSTGVGRFANLNGGTPSASWCKASSLRDDFNAGAIGDQWAGSFMMGGCTLSEAGGNAQAALVAGGAQECSLVSASAYDLTGDAMFTSLATPPSANGQVYSYLRASAPNGDNVEVTLIGTTLACGTNTGTSFTMTCTVAYDAVAHKFWQLAESGGMLSFQTSPDGSTWTTLVSQPPPFTLVGVNVAIGAGTNAAVAAPGTAAFSTFDQLPP
jgi:hypothetical protein